MYRGGFLACHRTDDYAMLAEPAGRREKRSYSNLELAQRVEQRPLSFGASEGQECVFWKNRAYFEASRRVVGATMHRVLLVCPETLLSHLGQHIFTRAMISCLRVQYSPTASAQFFLFCFCSGENILRSSAAGFSLVFALREKEWLSKTKFSNKHRTATLAFRSMNVHSGDAGSL